MHIKWLISRLDLAIDWPIFFDTLGGHRYNSPLMSGQQRLPVEVDPFRMAEQGRQFKGLVKIGSLKRLVPLLESADGQFEVELAFDVDEIGIKYVCGTLQAVLEMKCQRCLELMQLPLNSEFQLALVESEVEAEQLPETYEPLVVDASPIHLLDMLEDEILLSLPQIPMHSESECSIQPKEMNKELAEQPDRETGNTNPFAVLGKLKKDH